ncbi:hypothetical protein G7Z17_g12038 [Cylindrodendrum hubeiense]|uniref:Uncharacterized protein n=1 Tax=Cylindrodendrum hubeiense TaxID=595255 RepID=A0A9P5GW43_9HYPO|nr:hypothetical protein G7Z17_g12038 [Cylindrodendrum hubeiense]
MDTLALSYENDKAGIITDSDDKKSKRDVTLRGEGEGEATKDWRSQQKIAEEMWHYKRGERERTAWQVGQKGGRGEPFYYPATGIGQAVDILTEAERETLIKKWGH